MRYLTAVTPAPRQQQRGMTLIELMISITLGLFITISVIGAYLGISNASRTAEAIGRMNEDGQIALTILSQQLRMAGVNPSQPNRSTNSIGLSARGNSVPLHNSVTNAYAIRGCDLTFTNVSDPSVSTGGLTCAHTATSSRPDSISIAYEADRYNTVPTSTGTPTDCMGSGITPVSANYLDSNGATTTTLIYEAENRFYVGTSTSIVNPTLYCKGNATAAAQPLVENVEDLQLSYGTVNPDPAASFLYLSTTPSFTTTMVLGYLNAYEVDNNATLPGTSGLATPERWNAVKTVRICLVVRSELPIAASADSARYLDCEGTLKTPADRRLRRAFTTTVVLRNHH